jgi:Mg2+-importing ATPase
VLACVAMAIALPYTPLATWLGFVPPPPTFFAFLLAVVVTYLLLVEGIKRLFYRRYDNASAGPITHSVVRGAS